MIESRVLEWLDFGDSAQIIDVYSKKNLLFIFKLLRYLLKNKSYPIILDILFLMIFFLQIFSITLINVAAEKEYLLDTLIYLDDLINIYSTIIYPSSYTKIVLIFFFIIIFYYIILAIVASTYKKMNVSLLTVLLNLFNLVIFYYLIGPVVIVSLMSLWCENGLHKYFRSTCFTTSTHIIYTILSFTMFILYTFISMVYSFYFNEIGTITTHQTDNTTQIFSNYNIYCLFSKISIYIFAFFFYKIDYEEEEHLLFKSLYESFIFIICLIMSIYTYKYVYFYNTIMNNLHHFGWYYSTWFSFCILLKTVLNLSGISNFIVIGWIIITFVINKANMIKEHILMTESNLFEFNDIKSIEMLKNLLLKSLSDKNNYKTKILLFGINKKFEEFIINNPEINYRYQKLMNDINLRKKINKEDTLPILSIIFILYSFYAEKSPNKNEIIFHMCYYLINKFKNPTYAIYLCSKLKTRSHKDLFYKYLLMEDIKDYLIFKLTKNKNKESIKHVEIGSVILYYLYIDLFKIKIYDGLNNQIDYFDLLKNASATNKTTETFLNCGANIFKAREEVTTIWNKIIELNPFSDECQKDYMMYLEVIIQDESLAREEAKKYMLLKNNKAQEKYNIYHSMFLVNTSCVLLIDGYLSNGKILYASQNFKYLFWNNNGKEILSLTMDDLLPNCIQSFHKELVNNAIKYSNIKYIFKEPRESLLKNKNNGIFNIKKFVKPVPNLSYGLIYITYIQKIHDPNLNIILDKDLKISGFTEISQIDSSFTMNDGFKLTNNIIGYHIGLILPDILPLLEYKNDEFNIIKKDFELKGYLYPVNSEKDIKNKIDIILDKIKHNKININDYKGELEDDPQNISLEYNDYLNDLSLKNIKPLSVFYKVELHNFLDGKYKYYVVNINYDMISENDIIGVVDGSATPDDQNSKNMRNILLKNKLSKTSLEGIKKIKIKVDKNINKNKLNGNNSGDNANDNNNNNISKNISKNVNNNDKNNNKNSDNDGDKEKSNKNNDNENTNEKNKEFQNANRFNSDSTYSYKSSVAIKGCNKIKNDIINKKETFPLKMMKILCYIFIIIIISLMVVDMILQKTSFNKLATFLEGHLLFNKIKINSATLYSISVSVRWMQHSLFKNSNSHFNEEWSNFYNNLLQKNVKIMEQLRDATSGLSDSFEKVISEKHIVDIYTYKLEETEKYNYTLDNIFSYIINNGIKLMDKFNDFVINDCVNISKDLGLKEINLKNLIEQSYYLYNLNLNSFASYEVEKKVGLKISNYFPFPFLCSSSVLLLLLFFYIYYIISLHTIELIFLDKLINFNSPNFDNYIKKLEELKKKIRNDNNEEEVKEDDIDFNELDSKKKEEEDQEGNDNVEEKKLNDEFEKRNNKKKSRNKQSKIQQQRRKKLSLMISFFRNNNILFAIKIVIISFFSLTYYLVFVFVKSNYKNNFLSFHDLNDSMNQVFSDSFKIFIRLKRQLDLYENYLINCETIGNFKKMIIPTISEIMIPKFGNLIMQIKSNSDFKQETIDSFNSLYSDNLCKQLIDYSYENSYCENFWSGVLTKGLEQSIAQMGVIIGTVIDELNSLNENNNKKLIDLIEESAFIEYEQFCEYYLFKAYNETANIFTQFREEKLNKSLGVIRIILIAYIIITINLFILQIYFVYSFNYILSSFVNFIGILPSKYLSEDENFYNEIIRFGDKYY